MTSRSTLAEVVALHRAGKLDAAEAGYRRLIASTGSPDAMQRLATLLHQTGHPGEGLQWLDRALAHFGEHDGLQSNRAGMLLAAGRAGEALEAAQAVLARSPGHPGATKNRLLALRALARDTGDLMQKIRWYEQYREAGGDEPGALLDHANALRRTGQAAAALALFREARERHPDSAQIASSTLISACFDPGETTQSLSALARDIAALYAVDPSPPEPAGETGAIGFYSPRFAGGPIASLVLPVMRALRRRGYRLVLFSRQSLDGAQAAPFLEVAHAVHAVGDLDLGAWAELAAREHVGVLFDLCGHSPGNRLADFSRRLAPLQVCWGDWFLTTGVPGYDIYLGDAVANPPPEDPCFTERVVRLPGGRFSYALPPGLEPAQRPPPDSPVFGSFNRLAKLTGPTLDCWAELLRRAPEATLLLCSDGLEEEGVRRFTTQRFTRRGVREAQLEYLPFMDYRALLEQYRRVSVALDPFPFNGCVTTFDALAMGVPVVALHGRSPVARQSASILGHLGLEEWVARDVDGYIERAMGWLEPDANAAARRRLVACASAIPFDPEAFTAGLLTALAEAAISVGVAGLQPQR